MNWMPSLTGLAESADAWLENIQIKKTNNDYITIDATLRGAFSRNIEEAVSSGAPTRFRFLINIKKNRGFWFDKKIQKYEIYHTVAYDVLKKEYLITHSYPDGSENNLSTEEWDEMVQWMTQLESVHLELPEIEDQGADYFLNIRTEMKCIKIPFPLNYLLAFISLWNFDTPWVRVPLNTITVQTDTLEAKDINLR